MTTMAMATISGAPGTYRPRRPSGVVRDGVAWARPPRPIGVAWVVAAYWTYFVAAILRALLFA